MRGWKPVDANDRLQASFLAGHSAPTMRGWKPENLLPAQAPDRLAGHSAPTMRGWKLRGARGMAGQTRAGHSAPTMRGWKLGLGAVVGHAGLLPDTQPRQ